jgi:hypothetical protein
MKRVQAVVIVSFVFLLLGLTFNAYACLVPISKLGEMAGNGPCPASDESGGSASNRVCETFKTLGFTAPEAPLLPVLHAGLSIDQSLWPISSIQNRLLPSAVSSSGTASSDIFLTIAVLRI